ncbi:MAG TPA: alpha/beta fold hydrolase, partial [Pseudomonadota bacterium]|nr:alpha/beta fold hydrolase [Pseudomonadota bacterium]
DLYPVPIGVPGELHIGGAGVARGYLRRPGLTARRFIPNPFSTQPGARLYKTGDLARFLPDGNIEFLGRIDHQVKIRGFRIELGEIESVLSAHPDVASCVVLAREDVLGDKRLCAYVVLNEGRILDKPALRGHLAAKLPDYMLPAAFVVLDSLPLTPNGKVDRKQLPAPQVSRQSAQRSEPQSYAEKTLAEIYCRLLHLERAFLEDDFFALGGNSLSAMQLVSLANQERMGLGVREVFAHPRLGELASIVRQVETQCLVRLRDGQAEQGALVMVPGMGGTLFAMGMLSRALPLRGTIWGLTTPPLASAAPMPETLPALCAQYVREIQQHIPPGPLHLLGHSFGGSVAIELASQLAGVGREVSGIFLLDAWAPDQVLMQDEKKLLLQMVRTLDLSIDEALFSGLSTTAARAYVAERLQMQQLGGSDAERFLSAVWESARGALDMKAHWQPVPPSAPVHLLRAASAQADAPLDRGWLRYFPLASQCSIPGGHHSLLRPPYLQTTAQAVMDILEKNRR